MEASVADNRKGLLTADLVPSRPRWAAWPALVVALGLLLAGTAAAGAQDAAVLANARCSGCHGEGGNNVDSFFPRLAGQQKDYIISRLKGFADVKRVDLHAQFFMTTTAMRLSQAQVESLAAYYAKVPVASPPPGDSALSKRGEVIYRRPTANANGKPCIACHGENALGAGAVPRLAGQHADYLERQLALFKVGLHRNDVAHANVKNLIADDIVALAAYLEHL
ncbi:MAG TPA: c-type cytochrome [Bradyrhizobium sp.]|nr:c-type cytochrome [Bradyrhizobium sp.]